MFERISRKAFSRKAVYFVYRPSKIGPLKEIISCIIFSCAHLLSDRFALNSHHDGEDPLAELGAMLRNALLNAARAGLEGFLRQQRIETPAARLCSAVEPVGPDALCRLHLSGDEILFEELGHDARAFPGIDL